MTPKRKTDSKQSSRASQASSSRAPKQQKKIRYAGQGDEWPEGIAVINVQGVPEPAETYKHRVIIGFAILCGVLILVLTAHAIVTGNEDRLGAVFDYSWKGLLGVVVWATGKAVLKVLSGWKDK